MVAVCDERKFKKKYSISALSFLWFWSLFIDYLFSELLSIHSEMYLIFFINASCSYVTLFWKGV